MASGRGGTDADHAEEKLIDRHHSFLRIRFDKSARLGMQISDGFGNGGDGLGFGAAVRSALALEDIEAFFEISGVNRSCQEKLARREPILVLPAQRERLFGLR